MRGCFRFLAGAGCTWLSVITQRDRNTAARYINESLKAPGIGGRPTVFPRKRRKQHKSSGRDRFVLRSNPSIPFRVRTASRVNLLLCKTNRFGPTLSIRFESFCIEFNCPTQWTDRFVSNDERVTYVDVGRVSSTR